MIYEFIYDFGYFKENIEKVSIEIALILFVRIMRRKRSFLILEITSHQVCLAILWQSICNVPCYMIKKLKYFEACARPWKTLKYGYIFVAKHLEMDTCYFQNVRPLEIGKDSESLATFPSSNQTWAYSTIQPIFELPFNS